MKKMMLSLFAVCALISACVLAQDGAGSAQPNPAGEAAVSNPVDVLFLGYYIWYQDNYREAMEKKGIYLYSNKRDHLSGDTKLYPMELLRKFNVVVVSGPIGYFWSPRVISKLPVGMVDRLLQYQKEGGTVIWVPLGTENATANWTKGIGSRIGATALECRLHDPDNTKPIVAPGASSLKKLGPYTRTDNIAQHPITEGVKNLWMWQRGEWSSQGIVTMQFDDSWNVLVRGAKGSTARKMLRLKSNNSVNAIKLKEQENEDVMAEPPLVAIKEGQDGAGPMVVFPFYTAGTWGNYGHPGLGDVFLTEGDRQIPSDGEKLLDNLYHYLAATNRDKGFGGFHETDAYSSGQPKAPNLTAKEWGDPESEQVHPKPQQVALVGARTAQGGGSGSVADWAAAAKAAGVNVLVFLEDPAKYTHTTYKAFVKECKQVTTDDLAVMPGYGANDKRGVFRYFADAYDLPKDESGFLSDDGLVANPVCPIYDLSWSLVAGVAGFEHMPYDSWNNWLVSTGGVLLYKDGKLVDHGVERWLNECENNSSNLFPLSIVLMDSPDQIKSAMADAHRTMILVKTPDEARAWISKAGGGGGVMPGYVTNGPEIVQWGYTQKANQPWVPNSDMMRISVSVKSAAGLKQIKIVDRMTAAVVRDWRPGGAAEFTKFFDIDSSRQQVLSLEVVDVNGRTAYAAPIYSFYGSNRMWFMGDRLMGMNHMQDWDPTRTYLKGGYGGPNSITYVKTIPGACISNPNTPGQELKIRGLDGGNVYKCDLHVSPFVMPKGLPQERGSYQYFLKLTAHDLAIDEKVATLKLAKGEKLEIKAAIPVYEPMENADISCRNWLIRQYPEEDSNYEIITGDIVFTFKKDITVNGLYLVRAGWNNAEDEFDHLYVKPSPDADVIAKTYGLKDADSLKQTILPGGYFYQAPLLGGASVFVLREGESVELEHSASADTEEKSGRRNNAVSIKFDKPRAFTAGEKYKISILMATRKFDPEQAKNGWIEQMLKDYGVGVAPAYRYEVAQGNLKGINYFFDIDAENGGAQVRIKQYPLEQPLPVRVMGVSPQSVGGEYDLATKRVRSMPVFEGMLIDAVDPRRADRELYIGEFLRWNNPDVVVNVVPHGTDFAVEIHNPTDTAQAVTLNGVPGFAPLKDAHLEQEIPLHQSVNVVLQSTEGSVMLEAIR